MSEESKDDNTYWSRVIGRSSDRRLKYAVYPLVGDLNQNTAIMRHLNKNVTKKNRYEFEPDLVSKGSSPWKVSDFKLDNA